MAKQIYNPFHLKPEYVETREPETQAALSNISARFMQKASRHTTGNITSQPRQNSKPLMNRYANAIAISQPKQNAMKAVINNTSRPLSTTMIVVTSFVSPFDEEEDPEPNEARGPKKIPKRQKVFGNGISLAPTTVHSRMKAYLQGAQPAVVKMAGTGGGHKSASGLMRYITRNASMHLEKENGQTISTIQQQNELLEEWKHYFDKRQPSRDVVTLTANIKNRDIDPVKVQEALTSIYANQRLVSGISHAEDGSDKIVVVMTIASNKKGRIKTTEHALLQIQNDLHKKHGLDPNEVVISYNEVSHGVHGLTQHLKSALKNTQELSGPKDPSVTLTNLDKVARSWRRSLRSSGNRDIMHLIISARAGTDQSAFLKSARRFLAHEFSDHKYAFALHGPDDTSTDQRTGEAKATPHNHIHAMIVMRSIYDQKLNPNINDFQRWRENMAYFAREHGIDMVATKRGETLGATPYTKNEHEMAKKGKASKRTIKKVEAKQNGQLEKPRKQQDRADFLKAHHAAYQIKHDALKEKDANLFKATDHFLSEQQKIGDRISSDELYEFNGIEEKPQPPQTYQDALFDILNTQAFYHKNGVLEPLTNSINKFANLLIEDITQNEPQNKRYIEKGIQEFQKIYHSVSATLNEKSQEAQFHENTLEHMKTLNKTIQKTSSETVRRQRL